MILTSNTIEEDAVPNRCNFKKADWLSFQVGVLLIWWRRWSCLPKIHPVSLLILSKQQAKLYLKHTSQNNFPRFHGSVRVARKQLKKAPQKVFTNPVLSNVENFKLLRAKAHHVVKQQQKNSWRHFCTKLNSKTQTQKVWGKGGSNLINHLKVNGKIITDKKEVAEALAVKVLKNSSTENYPSEFQRIKMLKEKRRLDFSSTNEEDYNIPFPMTELKQSLQTANDLAACLDQVHYQLNPPPKFGSICSAKSV